MMQKHYKVQVPVDSMQAKRFKAKRTLEQKKESKHPSSPKKRCTEDQNHYVQNETKTRKNPYAALRKNKQKYLPFGNNNEKEETLIHALHATST